MRLLLLHVLFDPARTQLRATCTFGAAHTRIQLIMPPVLQGTSREGGGAALCAQVAELSRDNGILKRAVAIQNARLQVPRGLPLLHP